MPENEEKEKVIMGYRVKFKTDYDEADSNGEYIKLTIEISDELRTILKKMSINFDVVELVCISYFDSSKTTSIVRYKIKTIVNNCMDSSARCFLFAKELVDNGVFSVNLLDINKVLNVIEKVKGGIKCLLENIIGISNLSQEVSYNIVS